MSLYFILLLASISVPLLLSFDSKLRFYTQWKYVLPAILFSALLFIGFDVVFTREGVWGFNEEYISGLSLLGLPVEELLFFVVIPYASLFLHYAFVLYFPKIKLTNAQTRFLTFFMLLVFVIIGLMFTQQSYTFYISIKSFLILLLVYLFSRDSLSTYFISFLLILIPFIVVNGILTGSWIEGEVVWYNDDENLLFRVMTIPIEDFAYAFSMILLSLGIIDFAKRKTEKAI